MPRLLVGGVGYRFQRDASFGLLVSDALAARPLPPGLEAADLGYGALYVAQDLASAVPPLDALLLVAGVERGRRPGRLYSRDWTGELPPPEEIQARMREAGAGVVHIDHLLVIGGWLRALPASVRILELEPVDSAGGEGLSPAARGLARRAVAWVLREAEALTAAHVARAPA